MLWRLTWQAARCRGSRRRGRHPESRRRDRRPKSGRRAPKSKFPLFPSAALTLIHCRPPPAAPPPRERLLPSPSVPAPSPAPPSILVRRSPGRSAPRPGRGGRAPHPCPPMSSTPWPLSTAPSARPCPGRPHHPFSSSSALSGGEGSPPPLAGGPAGRRASGPRAPTGFHIGCPSPQAPGANVQQGNGFILVKLITVL